MRVVIAHLRSVLWEGQWWWCDGCKYTVPIVGRWFSLVPLLPMHTHTRTTHPHKLSATDPTRKGLSNRRVINLTTQSPSPRAVHCALVTRSLLYTVYTSSSTDVFLISRRRDDRNRYLHTCARTMYAVFFCEL